MRLFRAILLIGLASLSCGTVPRESVKTEAARLRASFAPHSATYAKTLDLENKVVAETMEWLAKPLANEPRGALSSQAMRRADRWAQIFFAYRAIQVAMREGEFAAPPVSVMHARIVAQLKDQYVEIHDFQRYCQAVSASNFKNAPMGRVPPELDQLSRRLRGRARAEDRVTPLLDTLPN